MRLRLDSKAAQKRVILVDAEASRHIIIWRPGPCHTSGAQESRLMGRSRRVSVLLAGAIAMVGFVGLIGITLVARQQPAAHECPPGQTETRPGNCQAPNGTSPSIVDYRPRSTLVTRSEEHTSELQSPVHLV